MTDSAREAVATVCLITYRNLPHFIGAEIQLHGGLEVEKGDTLYPASVVASLEAEVGELRGEVDRMLAERQAILGVGDGSGRLFVNGDHASIKECQRKLLAGEAAEGRVAELLNAVRAAHDRLQYLTINNGLKLDADLVAELKQALTGATP